MSKRNLTMIYAGLRIDNDRALQCFVHRGKEYHWSGVKYAVIGGKYIAVKDGEKLTMSRSQFNVGQADESDVDQKTRQLWEDKDRAAREFMRRRRDAAKAKNLVNPHWEALKPLHDRCQKLGLFERESFAKYVARLVVQGKHK